MSRVGKFEMRNGWWLVKREIDPALHQLKKPPAWAVDTALLAELNARGGVGVRIVTVDGDVYTATVDDLDTYGFPVNRGAGAQTAMTLDHWKVGP